MLGFMIKRNTLQDFTFIRNYEHIINISYILIIYHKYILFKLFVKIYYKNTMYFGNVLQNLIFVVTLHSRSNRNTKMLKFLFGCHIMKDFHRSIIDPIFNICDFFFRYCIKVCSFWEEPSN